MKRNFLLFFIIAIAMSSCSTMYKSGQTPDDVYYSPAREIKKNNDSETERKDEGYTYEDRNIRMSAYDRRWRTIDDRYDYGYRYDPYNYGYTYGYYYNPYYYASPVYCTGVTIVNPKSSVPRMTNLGSYQSTPTTSVDPKTGGTLYNSSNKNYRTYNNSNSNSSSNGKVINNVRRNNTNTSTNNNRTYNPSSSNNSSRSSSSGSSSSSGGSVQRNTRGNQ